MSGLLQAEATATQRIDDRCGSHVRCFAAPGAVPPAVVPDSVRSAVKRAGRQEAVLNDRYADLLGHQGVTGLPARPRRPRDKASVENGVLPVEPHVPAPLRNRIFHDIGTLNVAIAELVSEINARPYAEGSGESRLTRFAAIDRPCMLPLPDHPRQRTECRRSRVHRDHHIPVERHLHSVPWQHVGKVVDVRLRGPLVDVFHRGETIAGHARSSDRGGATTVEAHRPAGHRRAAVEGGRVRIETSAREPGLHVHEPAVAVMDRYRTPELGFRSCLGIVRLADGHDPNRFKAACRKSLEPGTRSHRGLADILRTAVDLAVDGDEPEPVLPPDHAEIRGSEYHT